MAEAKLTKKQQKAAQFKAGKRGKAAALTDHPATPDDIPEDAPSASVPETSTFADTAAAETTKAVPVKEEKRSAKRKRLAAEAAEGKVAPEDTPSSSKEDATGEAKPKKAKSASKAKAPPAVNAKKTTFGDYGEVAAEEAVKPEAAPSTPASARGSKFILFVGNMAFTTTTVNISKHFSQMCGEVPSVRLLTRKADPNALANLPASKRKSIAKGKAQDPTKPQSKGCAFVEFKSSEALRKALKFHHTMFEGRKINVELTAGGGGKGENRQEKIKVKNAELEKERQKLHGKYVAPKNEARKQAREGKNEGEERPKKRRRKEEGEGKNEGEERPKKRRRKEEGEQGEGGWRRNGGKERKMPRFMATGSNAVRVAPTS